VLSGQIFPFSIAVSANLIAMTLPMNTRSALVRVMAAATSVAVTVSFVGHPGSQPSSTDPSNYFMLPAIEIRPTINALPGTDVTPAASLFQSPWLFQESIASGGNKLFFIGNLANIQHLAVLDQQLASGTSVSTLSVVIAANNLEIDSPLFAGPLAFSTPPLAVQMGGTDGTNLRALKRNRSKTGPSTMA